MNRFLAEEEKSICGLLHRFTSKTDFWSAGNEIAEKVAFQRFGKQMPENEFVQEGVFVRGCLVRERSEANEANSGFSVVKNDEKEFRVELDVWPFQRDELMAMLVPGRFLTIKGEHGEKLEDGSYCSRKFQRYYCLPRRTVSSTLKCNYCNGILTIKVEKQAIEEESEGGGLMINIGMGVPKKNGDTPVDGKYSPTMLKDLQELVISGTERSSPAAEDPEPADSVKSNSSAEETPSDDISVGRNVREV